MIAAANVIEEMPRGSAHFETAGLNRGDEAGAGVVVRTVEPTTAIPAQSIVTGVMTIDAITVEIGIWIATKITGPGMTVDAIGTVLTGGIGAKFLLRSQPACILS